MIQFKAFASDLFCFVFFFCSCFESLLDYSCIDARNPFHANYENLIYVTNILKNMLSITFTATFKLDNSLQQ